MLQDNFVAELSTHYQNYILLTCAPGLIAISAAHEVTCTTDPLHAEKHFLTARLAHGDLGETGSAIPPLWAGPSKSLRW